VPNVSEQTTLTASTVASNPPATPSGARCLTIILRRSNTNLVVVVRVDLPHRSPFWVPKAPRQLVDPVAAPPFGHGRVHLRRALHVPVARFEEAADGQVVVELRYEAAAPPQLRLELVEERLLLGREVRLHVPKGVRLELVLCGHRWCWLRAWARSPTACAHKVGGRGCSRRHSCAHDDVCRCTTCSCTCIWLCYPSLIVGLPAGFVRKCVCCSASGMRPALTGGW